MEMLEGEDPAVIGWNAEGSSFTIHDMDRFTGCIDTAGQKFFIFIFSKEVDSLWDNVS